MGMIITPNSPLGRELWQWDHTVNEIHPDDEDKPRDQQLHGKRPATFQPYPKMLYMAREHRNGKLLCNDVAPDPSDFHDPASYERACLELDRFNRSCQRIVHGEDEERKAIKEGWRVTPNEALARAEGFQQDIAAAAAEAAFAAQRMSGKARAELKDADASTHRHVVDVKGSSKRRGRPKKSAVTATPDQPVRVEGD